VTINISSDGSSWWVVDGVPSNPAIQLVKGRTYYFANSVSDTHPFYIKTDWTNGYTFDVYSNGVTGSGTSLVRFDVPLDAPVTLYYQCSLHPFSMWGFLYTDTPPPPAPEGACCAEVCTVLNETICTLQGGKYLGTGTKCGVNLCPYVDPLPIPPVAQPVSGSIADGTAEYRIRVQVFQAKMHRDLPLTTLWCARRYA
jgi:hypothetical protein